MLLLCKRSQSFTLMQHPTLSIVQKYQDVKCTKRCAHQSIRGLRCRFRNRQECYILFFPRVERRQPRNHRPGRFLFLIVVDCLTTLAVLRDSCRRLCRIPIKRIHSGYLVQLVSTFSLIHHVVRLLTPPSISGTSSGKEKAVVASLDCSPDQRCASVNVNDLRITYVASHGVVFTGSSCLSGPQQNMETPLIRAKMSFYPVTPQTCLVRARRHKSISGPCQPLYR